MVKIDKKKCMGCGTCVSICSKVFELKGEKAKVKKGQEKSNLPCVQDAIKSCPESAISD
jgi:ferredoxin